MAISRIRGTQDFLDMSLYNFIIDQVKTRMSVYQFNQIATPIIEQTELFKRSLGLHTDVVTKEMFIVESDHEEKICLRPEMTASTARAFIEANITQLPWRVFSYGPLFRYERPQKGRYRQFHQINIEIIGGKTVEYDVQLITMLDRLFHETFLLNNYALLINYLGCIKDRAIYRDILKAFLETKDEICKTCHIRKEKNPLRVFDCKNPDCQTTYETAPHSTDHLCSNCTSEWQRIQNLLSLLSVSFIHQPKLVRGLDYYNKTAFEFVSDNLGAQNAFCGGGRYDHLINQLDEKKDYPAIGAAIGLERLALLLEPLQDQLPIQQPRATNIIIPLTAQQHDIALLIADTLYAHTVPTEILFEGSIKSRMRKAGKLSAQHVILIGQEEQDKQSVTVKNMQTGEQSLIKQIELVSHVT